MVSHALLALLFSLATPAAAEPPAEAPTAPGVAPAEDALVVDVIVEGGYHPPRIEVPAGRPVTLRFVRKEYTGCTREVVFPTLGLRRELPPNEPVLVDLGTLPPGEVPFHCGMHMIHGTIVVAPKE